LVLVKSPVFLLVSLLAAGAISAPPPIRLATSRASSRPSPRPGLTADAYADLAKSLRNLYSKPTKDWPPPAVDPGVEFVEFGLIRKPQFPQDNPFTEAKAELGKRLFFDPRLSASGAIACASCHEPQLGWSDGRSTSFGHARSPGARNAPTLVNIAHRKSLFWDGRAKTLEEQAIAPIEAANEMHADPKAVVQRLFEQPAYRKEFAAVFGDERITMERIAQAIATFERTIVSRPSRFDRFLTGQPHALSDSAVRGLHLFRNEARCANCHMGPFFTDEKFHDLGLSYYGRELQDLGRYEVTRDPKDVGKFKTPSLRNITRTGPYMHNGLFDLDGVLRMYNNGMATLRRKPGQENDPLFPTKSEHLRPLGLNQQDLSDLRAFLESLEEIRLRVTPPQLPGLSSSATTTQSDQPDER
jgi:cytochrome c peroxidase